MAIYLKYIAVLMNIILNEILVHVLGSWTCIIFVNNIFSLFKSMDLLYQSSEVACTVIKDCTLQQYN